MRQRILAFLLALCFLPGLAQAKIFLADTDDTLRVVTASGVSTIHMYAAWADLTTSALTPGNSDAQVTTATTTVLVAAPGSSTQRQIKGLSIRNSHASSSNLITVQFFDGATATELIAYTLLAGETLQWGEDENFRVIDASGQVKGQVALATGTNSVGQVTANAGTNLNTSSLLTTSAHDAAFGTAGSADAQVRSVQGIASMTPLLVNPGTASNFGITNFGSAFPTPGAAAGFTDGTNMVAGRVVTSSPSTSDAGLVVRNISPSMSTIGSAVPSSGSFVAGTDGTNARGLKTDASGELQVDVLTLPNVTIGTFPDNEPINIAQMNGVTVSMGVGASGTGTQRVASLLHDGTDTAQVTATAGGSLQVECTSGCGGSGGTSIADDAAFTPGTTSVTPAGAMFDDVTPDSVNEGDAGVVRMSANRNLYTTLRDAAGNERGANVNASNELLVAATGTVTANAGTNLNTSALLTSTNFSDAFGTAGTADSQVMSVQGIASMTPILTNPGTAANVGVYVEDAAETAGGNLSMSGTVRRDTAASSAGTTGDNATLNTDATGLLWTRTIDPCSSTAKTFLPINISTATTTEITPSLAGASTNYYVCSLVLVTAAANNIALVDDDSDGCGSVTSGLAGGTTSGSGFNMAANSGMTFGNGMGSVFKTNGTNRVICLVTSAATQLSGTMSVVAAP